MAAQTRKEAYEKYQKLLEDTVHNKYGNNKLAGTYYDVRGIRIYAETYGQGQPLLLLHGNNQSIRNFTYQIDYFKKNYKVIAVDSRGWGKSVDVGDSISFEMMADDIAGLLTVMKIDSANVIGWSDGGVCGLLLAIRHPEKVQKLAITGANTQPDSSAIYPELHKTMEEAYNEFKNSTYNAPNKKNLLRHIEKELTQPHISTEDLHNIACPTLIIGGDQDAIRPEHTLYIFNNIPKANLWILPNSGHYTPVAYADDFNNTVKRFFDRKSYGKFDMENRGF
jgi:pimeloyl-ACP methyl ester carboxylesterase